MEKVQDDAMNGRCLQIDGTVPSAALGSLTVSSSAGGKRLYGQNVVIIGKLTPHGYKDRFQ